MSDGVGQSTVSAVGQSVGLRDRGDLMEAGYLMAGSDFRTGQRGRVDGGRRLM